jgi:hypothetical protein
MVKKVSLSRQKQKPPRSLEEFERKKTYVPRVKKSDADAASTKSASAPKQTKTKAKPQQAKRKASAMEIGMIVFCLV